MPDRQRCQRFVAALALVTLAGIVLAAPAAFAAEEDWAGSRFDAPTKSTHDTERFAIAGTLEREQGESDVRPREIDEIRLTFSFRDGEADGYDAGCIPQEPVDEHLTSNESLNGTTSTRTFTLASDAFAWRCNGAFVVTATGRSVARGFVLPHDEFALEGEIRVAVPPVPIADLTVAAAGDPAPKSGASEDDPESVAITWNPLASPKSDALGYRVQRAGPADLDAFETIGGVISQADAGAFTDTVTEPGGYRYRVQSLRTGPDGPVASTDAKTPTADVDVAGPEDEPPTSTPGVTTPPTTNPLALPQVGDGTDNPEVTTPPLTTPNPPTTLDTGFNDTLDYGDRDVPEPGEELAGEGQSVIQTEAEGSGLLGPVAGALVLLGWAGHVAYLNRLAKQF